MKREELNIIRVVRGVAVAIVMAGSAASGQEIIDRILAVVSGTVITQTDAQAAIGLGLVNTSGARDPMAAALGQLVERELILHEVDRFSPPEPEAPAVDARVRTARSRFPSDAAFASAIAGWGIDESRLREIVKNDLRIQSYVDQRFGAAGQPTDEDVAGYYRDHPDEFTRNGRMLPFPEAADLARARLSSERRRALIAEWVDGLRRRAEVIELYLTPQ